MQNDDQMKWAWEWARRDGRRVRSPGRSLTANTALSPARSPCAPVRSPGRPTALRYLIFGALFPCGRFACAGLG